MWNEDLNNSITTDTNITEYMKSMSIAAKHSCMLLWAHLLFSPGHIQGSFPSPCGAAASGSLLTEEEIVKRLKKSSQVVRE